ncbi:hypothetical protein A3L11_08100 [Thermococcus siculi]|uniref:Uncharacterized protein n=1 Tax=Thermococcus siculi TaxID=72803 RepID=A0A2Z2MYG9_9EURY|nr:hypothetical protein A3L11_08100 [Thermococcus siculi]
MFIRSNRDGKGKITTNNAPTKLGKSHVQHWSPKKQNPASRAFPEPTSARPGIEGVLDLQEATFKEKLIRFKLSYPSVGQKKEKAALLQ